MHKVRGGGWSQLRYQDTSETSGGPTQARSPGKIERQVRTGPDLVILAGDVKTRSRTASAASSLGIAISAVRDRLPRTIEAEFVELDHGGRAVDGGVHVLAAKVQTVVRDWVITTLSAVHELCPGWARTVGWRSGPGRD